MAYVGMGTTCVRMGWKGDSFTGMGKDGVLSSLLCQSVVTSTDHYNGIVNRGCCIL